MSAEAIGPDIEAAAEPIDRVCGQSALAGYQTGLFIHNPYSRENHTTPAVFGSFEHTESQHGLDMYIDITRAEHARNVSMLERRVTPTTLIIVKAGDGGLGQMLGAVRELELPNPILAVAGGRKNDLVNQLFTKWAIANPAAALSSSAITQVRPIVASVRTDSEEYLEDAYAYTGIGLSGDLSAKINASRNSRWHRWRGGTYISERLWTAQTYAGAHAFSVSINGQEPIRAIDYTQANGNLMAGTLHPIAELDDPNTRALLVRNKLQGLGVTAALLRGRPTGTLIPPEHPITLAITSRHPITMHVNGEDRKLGTRADVTFTTAETGVAMLTNNKQARLRKLGLRSMNT